MADTDPSSSYVSFAQVFEIIAMVCEAVLVGKKLLARLMYALAKFFAGVFAMLTTLVRYVPDWEARLCVLVTFSTGAYRGYHRCTCHYCCRCF